MAATFRGVQGFWGMNTFLKVVLVVLAVIVAVKLLPVALAMACLVAGAVAVVGALGLSLAAGIVGMGLLLAVVLSPIWLPIMALVGIVALFKKVSAKPLPARA